MFVKRLNLSSWQLVLQSIFLYMFIAKTNSVNLNRNKPFFTGAHRLSGSTPVEKTFDVKKLIIHEKYSGRDPSYDIALLKLDGSIDTSDKVNIVCLPSQGSRVSAGKQCYITGYILESMLLTLYTSPLFSL